jgi:hypothetical protein
MSVMRVVRCPNTIESSFQAKSIQKHSSVKHSRVTIIPVFLAFD